MKAKTLAILITIILCAGCTHAGEIRPGIFIASDPATLPLPTSGYQLFVVGETHGYQETKQILFAYLKHLHQSASLRDVILEESPAYESEANAFVQGRTDSLAKGLCLRTDVLNGIREINASLPQNEQITVHLVDLDTTIAATYAHLQKLKTEIGPAAVAIQIPDYEIFKHQSKSEALDQLNQFTQAAGDDENIHNGLETVRSSLLLYFGDNEYANGQGYLGTDKGYIIREDGIAANASHLLKILNGKTALVFFGSAHTVKSQRAIAGEPEGFKPWVLQIMDSGVKVYSLDVEVHSGKWFWRGQALDVNPGDDKIQFANGTSLASLFDDLNDQNFLYVNLKTGKNAAIHALPGLNDIPAGKIYDGLFLIKQGTPMQDACS